MQPRRDDRHVEPAEIVGHDAAGVLPSINATRAAIIRLRTVAVLVAILNLTFVTVHQLAGDATEKDTRVDFLGVADHLGL